MSDELELARRRRKAGGRGRPSKLTPERQELIVKAVQAGNYFNTACEFAGVEVSTAARWMRRGEGRDEKNEPSEPFITFARAVREAKALAEMHKVAVVSAAAREHWQAAAWWLERTSPDRWGRRDRVTAEIDVRGEIEHKAPPPRSGERLLELVKLAREIGLVGDENIIDAEEVRELPEEAGA